LRVRSGAHRGALITCAQPGSRFTQLREPGAPVTIVARPRLRQLRTGRPHNDAGAGFGATIRSRGAGPRLTSTCSPGPVWKDFPKVTKPDGNPLRMFRTPTVPFTETRAPRASRNETGPSSASHDPADPPDSSSDSRST